MLILGWMKPVFWVFWTCFVVLAPSLHGIRPDSLLNPADSQETLSLCCGNHLCRDVGADFCRRRWEEVRLMPFCCLRGRIQLEALGWNCWFKKEKRLQIVWKQCLCWDICEDQATKTSESLLSLVLFCEGVEGKRVADISQLMYTW